MLLNRLAIKWWKRERVKRGMKDRSRTSDGRDVEKEREAETRDQYFTARF